MRILFPCNPLNEKEADFLTLLKVEPKHIDWISEKVDAERCELNRLDDNSNTISLGHFETYIAAEIERAYYERKGHKQTYSLIRNL